MAYSLPIRRRSPGEGQAIDRAGTELRRSWERSCIALYVKLNWVGIRYSALGIRRIPAIVVLPRSMTIFEAVPMPGISTPVASERSLLIDKYLRHQNSPLRSFRSPTDESPFYFISPTIKFYAEPMRWGKIVLGSGPILCFGYLLQLPPCFDLESYWSNHLCYNHLIPNPSSPLCLTKRIWEWFEGAVIHYLQYFCIWIAFVCFLRSLALRFFQ